MTQKELEKLAEKIYPSNETSMGYFDDDNEDRRLAFMLGYQAAQKMLDDMQSKKFDIYSQGYLDGLRAQRTTFNEEQLHKAMTDAIGLNLSFEEVTNYIKRLKNKNDGKEL